MGFKNRFKTIDLSTVEIETLFLDVFMDMKDLTLNALKVYLLVQKFSQLRGQGNKKIADIAKQTGLTIQEVDEAVNYWVDQQLMIKHQLEDELYEYHIEAVSFRDKMIQESYTLKQVNSTNVMRTSLTQEEKLAFARKDEVKAMNNILQQMFGKAFTPQDFKSLYDTMAHTHYSEEMVVLVAEFIIEKNYNKSAKNLSKIIEDFYNRGIVEQLSLEKYIHSRLELPSLYRKIKTIIGQYDNITKPQRDDIDDWLSKGLTHKQIEQIIEMITSEKGKTSWPQIRKKMPDAIFQINNGVITKDLDLTNPNAWMFPIKGIIGQFEGLTVSQIDTINTWVASGMEKDAILNIIKLIIEKKGTKGWNFIKTIVNNMVSMGQLTLEEASMHLEKHDEKFTKESKSYSGKKSTLNKIDKGDEVLDEETLKALRG